MSEHEEHKEDAPQEVPFLQKLYDRPILLLVAGLIVMFGFYTIWGVLEIVTLPKAPLP